MEDTASLNITDGSALQANLHIFPKSPFPAWVPAVTVAIAMIAFLAVSFYLRHRKVVKKRQILMDYCYVIFQYGGMRRKRMVTSLCNTNAITLRDLGRSFMISCDSGNDNSCPFFLEDSPFSKPRGAQRRPLARKHSFFKSRGMTITKRYRGPFIRLRGDTEDHSRKTTSSFQDIVMKFRTKRHHGETETATRQNLLAPQFEGCSMSTIHGDETDYGNYPDRIEPPVNYNRQRRNACVLQCDKTFPTFADVVAEAGRRSLGLSLADRFNSKHSPRSGKRNSEPWHNVPGDRSDPFHRQGQQPDVFHVHGGRLSPSNSAYRSHGYIPNVGEHCSSFQSFRGSEPTILVHSASTDTQSTQGWNDIRSKCTNGAVILQRVPKTDGAPGEFYYKDTNTPPLDRQARASLSKVSYVPAGNMNEYYNCISPNKETSTPIDATDKSIVKGTEAVANSSRRKRDRLSLGNLAVSNFNRRIDIASDSLPDYDPETLEKRKSSSVSAKEPRGGTRTTWTRLKRVFSGSRTSQSFHEQVKAAKSLSTSEAPRTISQKESTRWQRFVRVFTGFRSLPETKRTYDEVDLPQASNSYPLGLNLLVNNSEFVDLEANNEALLRESAQPKDRESEKGQSLFTTASFTEADNEVNRKRGRELRQHQRRPNTLQLQARTQSFPEEVIYGRPRFQNFETISEVDKEIHTTTAQPTNVAASRTRKHGRSSFSPTMPFTRSKKYFKSYSFDAGYETTDGTYNFKECPHITDDDFTTSSLEGNNYSDSESASNPGRVRSLSPLPETNLEDPNKDGVCPLNPTLDSVPDISVFMTPLENGYIPTEDSKFEINYRDKFLNSVDWLLQQGALFHNSSPLPGQSILHVTHFIPNESCDKMYSSTNADNLDKINQIVRGSSKPNIIGSLNCDSPLELIKPRLPLDTFPQTCYLTPEHRNVSCSTDSVYYDTVSALGTPSSCELADTPDFAGLGPHWNLEEIPCAHLNSNNSRLDIQMNLTPCNTNYASQLDPQTASIAHTTTLNVSLPDVSGTVSFHETSQSVLMKLKDAIPDSCGAITYPLVLQLKCSSELAVDNIFNSPAESKRCDSENSVETSTKIEHCISCLSIPPPGEPHFQALPIPKGMLHESEHKTTSPEASPKSSSTSNSSRRPSTSSPSLERSQSRQSGRSSPDEIYIANLTRLPRLLQRSNCCSTAPSCASLNVFSNHDNTYSNDAESMSEQAICDTAPA